MFEDTPEELTTKSTETPISETTPSPETSPKRVSSLVGEVIGKSQKLEPKDIITGMSIPQGISVLHNFMSLRDIGCYLDISSLSESKKEQVRVLEMTKVLSGVPTNKVLRELLALKDGYSVSPEENEKWAKYYYFLTGNEAANPLNKEQIDEIFERSIISSSFRIFFTGNIDDLISGDLISPEVQALINDKNKSQINNSFFGSQELDIMKKVQNKSYKKPQAFRNTTALQDAPIVRAEVLNWFFNAFANELNLSNDQKSFLLTAALNSYPEDVSWNRIPAESLSNKILGISEKNQQEIRNITVNEVSDTTDIFINCINNFHIKLQERSEQQV